MPGGDWAGRGGSSFQPNSRGQQRCRPGFVRKERKRLDKVDLVIIVDQELEKQTDE